MKQPFGLLFCLVINAILGNEETERILEFSYFAYILHLEQVCLKVVVAPIANIQQITISLSSFYSLVGECVQVSV